MTKLPLALPNGMRIEVPVQRHRRRRHLALNVGLQGAELRIPQRCSLSEARTFLEANTTWLGNKLSERSNPPPQLVHGSVMSWLGDELKVIVQHGSKADVQRVKNELYLSTPSVEVADLEHLIRRWGIEQGRIFLPKRTSELAKRVGKQPTKVSVGRSTTRWGTCNSKGALRFTWHLLKAPLRMIDSVIIHELCHLHEMNHSMNFWKLVEGHDPYYREAKQYFHKNGQNLLY